MLNTSFKAYTYCYISMEYRRNWWHKCPPRQIPTPKQTYLNYQFVGSISDHLNCFVPLIEHKLIFIGDLNSRHQNIWNIWVTDFYFSAIQMPNNCLVFKWHLNSGSFCMVFRCPVMFIIQTMNWISDNYRSVNNGPFDNQTNVHDLKTIQVHYSDPQCYCKPSMGKIYGPWNRS